MNRSRRTRRIAIAGGVAAIAAVVGTSATVAWAQTAPDAGRHQGVCATWVRSHDAMSPTGSVHALTACDRLTSGT